MLGQTDSLHLCIGTTVSHLVDKAEFVYSAGYRTDNPEFVYSAGYRIDNPEFV